MELEDALAAVREAHEHERVAMRLHLEALSEMQEANDILSRAVTGVLIPMTPPA